MCVGGSQAVEVRQWRRQRESGGPQEINKGADSELQPRVACVEEEVVERRLSALKARALSLKLTTAVLLLETNFKLSERRKDLSPRCGIFSLL